MATGKLRKYRDNRDSPIVFEHTEFGEALKPPRGEWHRIFGNDRPVVLELACGRGEYALALARLYPDRNFVGVDIKGARIWAGAHRAGREGLENVRFLRIFIEHLDDYFNFREVSEIWITFPDPYPKKRHAKKRLTSTRFLDLYRRVLSPDGAVHLKTDSEKLYLYTIETVLQYGGKIERRIDAISERDREDPVINIRTRFEESHLKEGRTIRYLRFRLPSIPS